MRLPLRSGMGTVTLAELQTALDLDPESDIYCHAYMSKNRACNEIPQSSSQERNQILGKIATEITQNGPTIASDRLAELLDELARTLICVTKRHWVLKGQNRCNQVDHVAGLLRVRLEDFEVTRSNRLRAEALIRSRRPVGRKGKGRASSSDESDEDHSGNYSNDSDREPSELDDESTAALPYRPKAVPRYQATAKSGQQRFSSQMKTPNRVQNRPSGSGRRRRKSNDSDVSTPGTAVSAVFSPVSSKWSATTISTNRPSTSRLVQHKQRNETPTRHRRVHDTTDIDPSSASEYEYGGESDDSSSSESSESQVAGHEESTSEDLTEDDESLPERIISFGRSKFLPKTANYILELMLSRIKKAPPGYIYCFSDKDANGFLKIGYAGIADVRKMQPGAKMPIAGYDTRSSLWERLESQRKRCKYNMKFEFDVYMPSAVHKIEKLIHATLREHNKTVTCCRNPKCKTKHEEWFKITLSDAKHTVNTWKKFSRLKPWTANGALAEKWSLYAHDNLAEASFATLSIQTWFHEEWEKTVARAGEHKREMAKTKRLKQEVDQAKENLDEKQRLLDQVELDFADRQRSKAIREKDRAEEQLEEKKRQLALQKKRRTTFE